MKNTAEVRKENTTYILQTMCDGKEYTARTIADKTGLSVATCNTILNILKDNKKIIGESRRLGEVGRPTFVYRINAEYDSALHIMCIGSAKEKRISAAVVYAYGGARAFEEEQCAAFDAQTLCGFIWRMQKKHGGIVRVLIGIPLSEAENLRVLRESLSSAVKSPVDIFYDYEYIACGMQDKRLTTIIDLSEEKPRVINIYGGGLLYGVAPADFTVLGNLCGSEDIAVRAALCAVALLSPVKIIFTGNGAREKTEYYRSECSRYIQEKYLPPFVYEGSLRVAYMRGMSYKAQQYLKNDIGARK